MMLSVGLLSVRRAEDVCALQVQRQTVYARRPGFFGGPEPRDEWHVVAFLATGEVAFVAKYQTTKEEAIAFMHECATTLGLGVVSSRTVARLADVASLYVLQTTILDGSWQNSEPVRLCDIMLRVTVPTGSVRVCLAEDIQFDEVAEITAGCRANISITSSKV